MPGRIDSGWTMGHPFAAPARRLGRSGRFRILVAGSFGGRFPAGSREGPPGNSVRRAHPVDVDTFGTVLRRLAPEVRLQEDVLRVEGLDDLHPDSIYRRLSRFAPLQAARERLLDPATSPGPALSGPPLIESERETLGRLLGSPSRTPSTPTPPLKDGGIDLTPYLRNLVAPYLRPDMKDRQHLVDAVDQAAGQLLRGVLHDPAFQQVESLWRSLHLLATSLETGEDLEIRILALTKHELVDEVAAAGPTIDDSVVLHNIFGPEPGDDGSSPYSLLVLADPLEATAEDAGLLACLGTYAARAGGPVLAAAPPGLLGLPSFSPLPPPSIWTGPAGEAADAWRAFRRSPGARSVGLTGPRLLLRLPYGPRTDPIDTFAFEEVVGAGRHEDFLWGNPAFGVALVLGRAFLEDGAALDPDRDLEIDDLPLFVYEQDLEKRPLPCAEAYLSESIVEAFLNRGVMPWISQRRSNAVRLARLQSAADPPTPLSGPWS